MKIDASLLSASLVPRQTRQCLVVPRGADPLGRYRTLRRNVATRIPLLLTMVAWAVSIPPAHSQSANDGFDPNVNGPVNAIAVQADGRILIGGAFTSVGGTARTNLARLTVDGSVDLAFELAANDFVQSLAVQPDGRILVGGNFTALGGEERLRIGRLNTDGSLDLDFKPGADSVVMTLAVLPGGKILAGGRFVTLGGVEHHFLGRLNTDGSLDTSFTVDADGPVFSLVVQADGKILVGGGFKRLGSQWCDSMGRLNADGTVDTAFNVAAAGMVYSLAVQADGRILVGGSFTRLAGEPRAQIGRLNLDGTLDAAFDPGTDYTVYSLAVQTDGRILVGGGFTTLAAQPRSRIGRLNTDGTIDSGFNPGASDAVRSLAVQADGKILAGGAFTTLGGTNRNHLARLYLDGSVDATLNPGASGQLEDGVHTTGTLAVQPDGNILVGGSFTNLGGQSRSGIGRVGPDGSLDLPFDPGADRVVWAFGVQPDGKILVAGRFHLLSSGTSDYLGRLNRDGTLDTNFNPGAITSTSAFPVGVFGLAVQPDSRIIIGGDFTSVGGEARYFLARLDTFGSLDSTFHPGADRPVRTVALQPDGKVLVGGTFTSLAGQPRSGIGRLNPDGTLDPRFDPGADGQVNCFLVQPDGRIVVGGFFTVLGGQPRSRVGRLNADGSLDTSFNPGVRLSEGLGDPYVRSLALQVDGSILVAGYFDSLAQHPAGRIGRLDPGGGFDTAFSVGVGDMYGSVWGVALQADGKILLGGKFSTVGGQPRSDIARLSGGAAAVQALTVNDAGTMVTWSRSGSGPEIEGVTAEFSENCSSYVLLGYAKRVPGGWQVANLALPIGQSFFIRARGRVSSGCYNNSSSLIESVRQFYLPPRITSVAKLENGNVALRGAGPASQPCVLLTTPDLLPPLAWSPIVTNTADTNGVVTFPDLTATNSPTRFYQLRWP